MQRHHPGFNRKIVLRHHHKKLQTSGDQFRAMDELLLLALRIEVAYVFLRAPLNSCFRFIALGYYF